MFGNSKGWIMSGAIMVLVALLIYYGSLPPQISDSSHKFDKFRDSAVLSVDPLSLGIKTGDKDCDAGDLYRQVIDDYKANKFHYKAHYEDAKDALKQLEKDPPPSVQWVVDAADCHKGTPFGRKPQEIVNYDNNQDSIDALHAAGNYAGKLAALDIGRKKYDEAEPLLRGEFILGYHLYFERLRWAEYIVGTELMSEAARGMAKIADAKGDKARADQFSAFIDAINTYEKNVAPLWLAISTGGADGQMLPYPGDMFDFARNSKEPMWRTEAVLKLGRMRYMGNLTAGDQRGANRLVAQMAEDKSDLPPNVHTAAEAAHELTVEKFRMFGGGS